MMRLVLAVVVALVAAAPAMAQEATPVVGAGSFTSAPILEPGTYRDTVLPEEYLYYGVRVAAGQRLRVTLDAGLDPRELADLGLAFVQVNLHGPDRAMLFGLSGRESTAGSGAEPVDIATNPADTIEEARTSTSSGWEGPGVYFIAVYAVFVGSGELTKAEIPITFTVALEGQAQSEPTPTPSPTLTPRATAAPPEPDAQDSTPMAAAGAGVAGLLAGVVGGIALRRRRR